jgi:hypothetical protein
MLITICPKNLVEGNGNFNHLIHILTSYTFECLLFLFIYHFDLVQNAGTHSFSIGVTEVLNTNLLIELSADDIEYVYQR